MLMYIQPLLSYIYGIRNNKTNKEILQNYILTVLNYLKCSMFRISKQNIIHKKNIIYFGNHRSWFDSIGDVIATNYSGKYIYRTILCLVFPFLCLLGKITGFGYVINRGSKNIIKMFDDIYKNTYDDPEFNLLVYPEGTRRPNSLDACDLKKGFIYYAFDHKMSIQFIISLNKEKVVNEKIREVNLNQKVYVYYSKEYSTKKFINKNKDLPIDELKKMFYDYINSEWKKEWDIVYSNKEHKNKIKPIKLDINKIKYKLE